MFKHISGTLNTAYFPEMDMIIPAPSATLWIGPSKATIRPSKSFDSWLFSAATSNKALQNCERIENKIRSYIIKHPKNRKLYLRKYEKTQVLVNTFRAFPASTAKLICYLHALKNHNFSTKTKTFDKTTKFNKIKSIYNTRFRLSCKGHLHDCTSRRLSYINLDAGIMWPKRFFRISKI